MISHVMVGQIAGGLPARLVAVSTSLGGIPKLPRLSALATHDGLLGDGHAHAKHNRPDRAISLLDLEIIQQLVREGFSLAPGATGENLTVAGLHVQSLSRGTLLRIGDVLLRLEEPRKPCYVLDAIDPRLKLAIVNRCGYMASVVEEGVLTPDLVIQVVRRPAPLGEAAPTASNPLMAS